MPSLSELIRMLITFDRIFGEILMKIYRQEKSYIFIFIIQICFSKFVQIVIWNQII